MERTYSVTPVRPSVSVRVRDGISNLRLNFSGVSNLRLSFSNGGILSFGLISSIIIQCCHCWAAITNFLNVWTAKTQASLYICTFCYSDEQSTIHIESVERNNNTNQIVWMLLLFATVPRHETIIRIHYECSCRIGKSRPRGRNFNQGRGLPSPWLKFLPEGEISLFCMDWLMMDSFSPTFKWIVPRTSGSTSWSCEIEISHMGKSLPHTGKGGRKKYLRGKCGQYWYKDIYYKRKDLWEQ